MTGVVALDEPLSVRRFLGDDDGDSLATLAETAAEQGFGRVVTRVLQQATESARSAVSAEVMRSVDGLLDLDLGGLLAAGWRKYGRLTDAAEQSRAAPATSVVVSLLEHTVTSTHRPRVDLLVRENRVASIHLELSVRFTVRGLAATVRDGKLVSLTGGAAEIGVGLSVEGNEIARRRRRLDVHLVVRLGSGIPLGHGGRPPRDVPAEDVPAEDVPAGAPPAAEGSGGAGFVVHLPSGDEPLSRP